MRGIQQISSPGKRTYMSMKRILKYSEEQNWGENKTLFLSTSQGIMNHREILISFDNGGAKPLDPKGQTSYGNSEGYAFQSTELPSLHSNGCKGPNFPVSHKWILIGCQKVIKKFKLNISSSTQQG
jgi:hypothetical protein